MTKLPVGLIKILSWGKVHSLGLISSIIGKTKSFHPTFYESKAKIDMLISLERWYNKVQRYTIKGN